MEQTLVIIKPSAIQRGLIGDVITRFERKGLQIVGTKMIQLDNAILDEHYAHLVDRPFFQRIKDSMMSIPVIVLCLQGIDAVDVVRCLVGCTNGREAAAGTIRGDFSIAVQENIVHASDSREAASTEIARFFNENEIFNYKLWVHPNLYANDEI
ncbi:MAG: nucleoside-diphosphate kinase [Bacteroidales bacterium 45-6]|nr:MAG: nucleoside-diphosphate kinase [Bacteroidales bacterium 45-6]